jgi:hypothetical protein
MTHCIANPRRSTALPVAFALILAACALAPFANAQKRSSSSPSSSTDYAEFQNATLSGTSDTINVVNVPIVTSSGTTYDNVTITFTVSSTGTLKVSSTTVVAAPEVQIDGFAAGTYQAPAMGETIIVSGPGIESGGETEWSFATTTILCQNQESATWYVGPIASSPYYSRITAAGVPLTGYSYGVGGGSSGCGAWNPNSLLGFSQTGSQLTITDFSNLSGQDQSEPYATISYTPQ